MDLTKDSPQAVHSLINPDLEQEHELSPVFILLRIMPSGKSIGSDAARIE
jgi:hypothetical protein